MADLKWIKIATDIFDDEKILLIESLPDAYTIITVWFKLLCLAGKQNNSGVFLIGRTPYNGKMLATIFRMKEAKVTMALKIFEQFGMVEIVDGVITIPNWGKHQNLDQMESKKAYMQKYMREYREKQKELISDDSSCKTNCKTNSKSNVSKADKEGDKEEDKDIDKEGKENKESNAPSPQQIIDLFNSTCVSLPSVQFMTANRKQAIEQILNTYTIDNFKLCFELAEKSSFLKGKNERDWVATFDWLISEENMAKVLEGNFSDNKKANSSFDTNDFFEAALQRSLRDNPDDREVR